MDYQKYKLPHASNHHNQQEHRTPKKTNPLATIPIPKHSWLQRSRELNQPSCGRSISDNDFLTLLNKQQLVTCFELQLPADFDRDCHLSVGGYFCQINIFTFKNY